MPEIQVTIPTSGHDIRLIQITQFQDGSQRFRIKLDDKTFDVSMWHGEIDGLIADSPDDPLPDLFTSDPHQGN